MKLLMLMGAVLGFGVGFGFSLVQESSWPSVVWRACAAAYAAGLVLRWWGRRWEANLRVALIEKHEAVLRAESAAAASPHTDLHPRQPH